MSDEGRGDTYSFGREGKIVEERGGKRPGRDGGYSSREDKVDVTHMLVI